MERKEWKKAIWMTVTPGKCSDRVGVSQWNVSNKKSRCQNQKRSMYSKDLNAESLVSSQ